MSGFWRQAGAVARTDLRVEGRAGEVLFVTIPFGAVALLLVPMAIGTDIPLLARLGPGLFWAVVLLFGMLVAFRQSASDGGPQRDLWAMLGVDPVARLIGRALSGTLLIMVFEVALAVVTVVLYDPDLVHWGWILVLAPLVAVGLAVLGTLASALTAGLRTRAALAPLLVAPLATPLLLGATQVLEGLDVGRGILPWLLLMITVDLVLIVIAVIAARPLEESPA